MVKCIHRKVILYLINACRGLRDEVLEPPEPIAYICLQQIHVQQVHELLTTAFWPGIDSKPNVLG